MTAGGFSVAPRSHVAVASAPRRGRRVPHDPRRGPRVRVRASRRRVQRDRPARARPLARDPRLEDSRGDLPDPKPPGNAGAITGAWNGAALDTKRNRLLVTGGGHLDYAGNEIYAFDFGTLELVTDLGAHAERQDPGGARACDLWYRRRQPVVAPHLRRPRVPAQRGPAAAHRSVALGLRMVEPRRVAVRPREARVVAARRRGHPARARVQDRVRRGERPLLRQRGRQQPHAVELRSADRSLEERGRPADGRHLHRHHRPAATAPRHVRRGHARAQPRERRPARHPGRGGVRSRGQGHGRRRVRPRGRQDRDLERRPRRARPRPGQGGSSRAAPGRPAPGRPTATAPTADGDTCRPRNILRPRERGR